MLARYNSTLVKKMFAGKGKRYPAILAASFFILFFSATQFVFAETQNFKDPLGEGMTLEKLLMNIIRVIIYVMTPIITLMVVYTGFLFVMAQGNPGKLSEARTALMWCLIGAVIVLGAFGISMAIKSTITSVTAGAGTSYVQLNQYV